MSQTTLESTVPHGFHADDAHGHVIVSQKMLVGVISALAALTILTVGASRAEVWISQAFNWDIPQWVNVTIAMSIAVVKASLVCLFFMQLLFDNKLNSMIMLFCLLTFGLFIGLTSIDLVGRDAINVVKAGEVDPGGLGGISVTIVEADGTHTKVTVPAGTSLVNFVKERAAAEGHTEHEQAIAKPTSSPDVTLPALGMRVFAGPDPAEHAPAEHPPAQDN